MKKWLKFLLVLGFLGIVAVFLIYKFYINKPHPDFEAAVPEYVISANDLFDQYVKDKSSADKLYTGKVIQIEGILSKKDVNDTNVYLIFVYNEGMFGDEGIRCRLLPKYNRLATEEIEINSDIEIKGFCAGYNETDVILDKCSILD